MTPVQERNATAEEAVIVEFKYGLTDLGPLRELEDRLAAAIDGVKAGDYDGDEIATDLTHGFLYLHGPNADRLFGVARPVLESASFMRDAVVRLRFGPPGRREIKVVISPSSSGAR